MSDLHKWSYIRFFVSSYLANLHWKERWDWRKRHDRPWELHYQWSQNWCPGNCWKIFYDSTGPHRCRLQVRIELSRNSRCRRIWSRWWRYPSGAIKYIGNEISCWMNMECFCIFERCIVCRELNCRRQTRQIVKCVWRSSATGRGNISIGFVYHVHEINTFDMVIFSIYVGGRTRINSRCYISSIVTTGWQRLEILHVTIIFFILILIDTIDHVIRIVSLASRHFAWAHRCPGVWLLTRPLVWPRIVTACCKSSSEFRGQLTSDCCRRISRKVIQIYI